MNESIYWLLDLDSACNILIFANKIIQSQVLSKKKYDQSTCDNVGFHTIF